MPSFHMKHETKLKRKQNVALYNPRHLNKADVSNAQTEQYCNSEFGNTLFSAHTTTVEYVTRYSYYFVVSEINITT